MKTKSSKNKIKTLGDLINLPKIKDSAVLTTASIPIKHPETGEKIYMVSNWFSGFWYRKQPNVPEGQMWPVQYRGDLLQLEVHPDFKKELAHYLEND